MKKKAAKCNKIEQVISDSYPVERINPHSKDPEHSLEVLIPKRLYPDFYIPLSGNFIECKDGSYVRDDQWVTALRYMSDEQRERYKVIIKNPNKMTKWANVTYGMYLTMAGIDWSEFPKAKDEWFKPKSE